MYSAAKGNKFPRDKEGFLKRQERALAGAMERNRLSAKHIAQAIGVHGDTVENWAKGEAAMTGDAIEAVERFMLSIGDFRFFAEIYGDVGVQRVKRAIEVQRQARKAVQLASALGTGTND